MGNASGSLTQEQLEFYEREGYLVLPDLLRPEDMRPAREAMEAKVETIAQALLADGLVSQTWVDDPFERRLAHLFEGLSDAQFLRYGRSWRDRLPGYYWLMRNVRVLDAVESLIGGEIFANPVYNVRPKVPGVAAGAVPWHQDKSYWPGAKANPVITVWISLVDATLDNGCLHIKPRTHRRELVRHGAETYSGTGYTQIAVQDLGETETVSLPVRAGSAILFNDRCLHMSTPNRSETVRWSVDLRYQSTDQDRMVEMGAGFLARSRAHPERVATLDDWLAGRMEHEND
jgi:hypothetical protein